MRLMIAAALIVTLGAGPAIAQEDKPFEGASLTAVSGVDGVLEVGDFTPGLLYGVQAGYDLQSKSLVYGIEAEVTDATGSRCYTIYMPNAQRDRSCAHSGRTFYVGGRVGAAVSQSTLLYVKAGYTNFAQKFDYQQGASGPVTESGTFVSDGVGVGAGVEQRLGGEISIKTEYRYSSTNGLHRHQAVAGLGIRF